MLKILGVLLLTLTAHASLNDVDKANLINDNLLSNPGFENGLAGYVESAGTEALVTSGTNLLKGDRSVTWDAGAATQTYCSPAYTIEEGMKGENGLAELYIKVPSGTATHEFYAYDGSNDVGSRVTVGADRYVRSNFIFPSSGTVQWCLEAQADEPLIAFDMGYIGRAANITDIAPQDVLSAKVSTTGGVSDENEDWLSGNCTNANPMVCTFNTGEFSVAPNCHVTTNQGGTTASCQVNTSVGTTSLTCNNDTGTAIVQSVNKVLTCQKTGADAPIAAVKADQTNRPWTAYTPTFNGLGTPTAVDFRWKRQGEDMLIRGNFTCGTSTASDARAGLPGTFEVAAATDAIELAGYMHVAVNTTQAGTVLITGGDTFVEFGLANSGAAEPLTGRNGNTLCSSGQAIKFEARVPIEGWIETNEAPLVKNSVVSTSEGVVGTESVRIDNAGTPTVGDEQGDWVDSLVDNSAGNTTINIKTGVFSQPPQCQCTVKVNATNQGIDCFIDDTTEPSATVIRVQTVSGSATTAEDEDFYLHCRGER